MNIVRALSTDFVGPAVTPLGMVMRRDLVFEKWSGKRDFCATLKLVELRGAEPHYTVDIGFSSTFINGCYGLSPERQPVPEAGTSIFFRLDEFFGRRLQTGWPVTNKLEAQEFGAMFRDKLVEKMPALLEKYLRIDGWIDHLRERLETLRAGRGHAWSMLGYALLSRENCSVEEICQVIEGHALEDSTRKLQNRIDLHLARQRTMVLTRFGVECGAAKD
jgi:hypothetical protein